MLANIINLAAGQATWYRGGEGAGGGGGGVVGEVVWRLARQDVYLVS